jgi:hypothetical protein
MGDFNADGLADILWHNSTTRTMTLWTSDRTQGFSSASVGTYDSGFLIKGVADFDGNGTADILFHNPTVGTGNLRIWRMHGARRLRSHVFSRGTSWSVASVGDFNGDGRADILWDWERRRTFAMWMSSGSEMGFAGREVGEY